jgi:hypothetical protein
MYIYIYLYIFIYTHMYIYREFVMEESEKLKLALEVLGDDIPTIFGLLMNPAATGKS